MQTLDSNLGIYIHIPFCHKKCPYCDFYVEISDQNQVHTQYVQSILDEIDLFHLSPFHQTTSIESIYFGGGTPSLVDPKLLQTILNKLSKQFAFAQDIEITLECNPEDCSIDKIQAFKHIGINRISLGLQSMLDTELDFLGRNHDKLDSKQALKNVIDTNFKSISIDLMYQLPNQSMQAFEQSLTLALQYPVQHLSLYGLTIEAHTPFFHQVKHKKWTPLEDKQSIQLYYKALDFIESHGFERYESSNFAKTGHRSRHNQRYWQQKNYWGLGVSAHSFFIDHNNGIRADTNIMRFNNGKQKNNYSKHIQSQQYPIQTEHLTSDQLYFEIIFTHLRSCGLNLNKLYDYLKQTQRHANIVHIQTLVEQLIKDTKAFTKDQILYLSSLGHLLSDQIAQEIVNLI